METTLIGRAIKALEKVVVEQGKTTARTINKTPK